MLKNKTFLITGGAGFIGSTLAGFLAQNNRIIIIDNFSTGNINNLEYYVGSKNFSIINEDVRYSNQLEEIIEISDFVIHLAATVGVMPAVEKPVELLMNNIVSTERVLNLCKKYDKRVFIASSSEIYGKVIKEKLSENDYSYIGFPQLSRWIYSISKIGDEFIAYALKRKGLRVIIGRFFNFIGINQSPYYGMVVPKFISQVLKNEPITVYGDGTQRRSFTNVNDGCNAIIKFLENFDVISELENVSFNIGSHNQMAINDLALLIRTVLSGKSEITYIPYKDLPAGYDELMQRNPDTNLIYNTIGWKAETSIEETIKQIMNKKGH
jgi:UDP-glucose 4-epimerase